MLSTQNHDQQLSVGCTKPTSHSRVSQAQQKHQPSSMAMLHLTLQSRSNQGDPAPLLLWGCWGHLWPGSIYCKVQSKQYVTQKMKPHSGGSVLKSDCVTQGDESAKFPLAPLGIHPFAQEKKYSEIHSLILTSFTVVRSRVLPSPSQLLLLCLPPLLPAGKGQNKESSDSHLSQDHLVEASKSKFITEHARCTQGDMHAKQ